MGIDRRQFICSSMAVATTAAMGRQSSAALATKDIRVAQIGFRARGLEHLEAIRTNIVALCDVDRMILDAQMSVFKEMHQPVDGYTDFRRLLERPDIDAVSIATPNHTHALIAIEAIRAGKHVYVEKPVSHNIWEGRQLVAAARRFNCIAQAGTQARSSTAVRSAVAYVQSGRLGKIKVVTGTCYKPRASVGKRDSPLVIPASIDYDLWCGPAEKKELFRPQLHYDWHWDFNTGNGDLGNQGIHQMDIARWFLGETKLAPRVFSVGGRVGYEDAADTANTQIIYHEYEKAPLIFEVRGLPRAQSFQIKEWSRNMDTYRGSRVGVVVQCERGRVVVQNYLAATAYDNQGKVVERWKSSDARHHENWLSAIEARDPNFLQADIYEGHVSSALCHAGNISYRLGSKARAPEIADQVAAIEPLANAVDRMLGHLRANGVNVDEEELLSSGQWLAIDPEDETFAASNASALRSRDYRKPFQVPDIERGSPRGTVGPI